MVATTLDEGWSIARGTPVYTADGEKLGGILSADAYTLVVERGFLFPTDYVVAIADVERYEDGRLFLKLTKTQVLGDGAKG